MDLPGPTSPLLDLEPFGRIRLIAFDLDGTLLRNSSAVPGERFLMLHRSARSYGVRLTLATGRTLWGARKVIDALGGLGRTPVILYNGSVVIDPSSNSVLQRETISPRDLLGIGAVAEAEGVEAFVYEFRDPVLGDAMSSSSEVVYGIGLRANSKEFNGMSIQESVWSQLGEVRSSAVLLLPPTQEIGRRLVQCLKSIAGISTTGSGAGYVEIRPAGVSKAHGFKVLAQSLGISSTEVLAVGDNDNDVEMMQWAGVSVAVDGASGAARNAATYISSKGPEQAAIEAIDLVRKAKRLNKGRTQRNAPGTQGRLD